MADDAGTLATARIKLIADARGVPDDVRNQTQKGLANAGEKAGSNFGKRMAAAIAASVVVGAVVIGKKLVDGLKQSISAASDLNEVSSKASVIFGKNSKELQKFARNSAKDLGQSKIAVLDGASTFGIYGKAAKLSGSHLVTFSTKLVGMASDMASFSNTKPEEAISAIGSAMRGEFDPIEKYGVLLNESVVKAKALKLGLIETTKDALTPQQRVLAVNASLYEQLGKKGSKTLGDFERTSAGLANQQRIAAAQTDNLKAKIGAGLLPAAIKLTTVFNTKVIPALNVLWEKHGPKIVSFLSTAADKFGAFVTKIAEGGFEVKLSQLTTTFEQLRTSAGPALKDLVTQIGPAAASMKENLVPALQALGSAGGKGLADTINVGAVAMKFLADHADLLAKVLPYLVVAMVAYKVTQIASNIAMAASPALRLLELSATRRQTAAIVANTAARAGETTATGAGAAATIAAAGAENGGILARGRAVLSMVAHKVATIASTAVTWLMTAATTAMGVALKIAMGPVGLIIVAIGALVAVVIYAYKHNETFRKIVDAVWKAIKIAIKATVDWLVNTAWPFIKKMIDALVAQWKFLWSIVQTVWKAISSYIKLQIDFVLDVFGKLKNFIMVTLPNAFHAGTDAIGKAWAKVKELARIPVAFVVNSIINPLIGGYNKIAGIFGAPQATKISGFAEGGQIPGPPARQDNRWAWLRDKTGRILGQAGLATGEFVVNARDTARALPLLHWINDGMRGDKDEVTNRIGRKLVDKPGDGSEGWAFAKGGLVGFLSDVWGAVTDPAAFIKRPIETLLNQIPGAGNVKSLLVGMGRKLISGLTSFLGGGGSGTVGKAQAFVRAQSGKPYIWASAGPSGYDCSGIVSAVYNVLHGKSPYNHTFSTASLPGRFFPKPGIGGPLTAGWAHPGQRGASASVGHMSGMVGGLPFSSAGSRGVQVGASADKVIEFAHIGHYDRGGFVRRYDTGGVWPTGTFGVNDSGHTEHVLTGGPNGDVADLRDLLTAILAVLRGMGGDVAAALNSNTRRAVQVGRGRGVAMGAM